MQLNVDNTNPKALETAPIHNHGRQFIKRHGKQHLLTYPQPQETTIIYKLGDNQGKPTKHCYKAHAKALQKPLLNDI